jgi:hypothetical protein
MYPWQPSEYRSNRKTSEPFTTRQFFLLTLVLGALSFIPVIGWFSALFLVISLIAWILSDPRGFLSVLWRALMVIVLLCSCGLIIEYSNVPSETAGTAQFLTASVIGLVLSISGLARSIIVARQQDI